MIHITSGRLKRPPPAGRITRVIPGQDTPSLLVVDVVAESPAEKQGVRLGSRLAKINGMHVDPRNISESS